MAAATAAQKAADKAGKEAAAKVKADGGDKAAQDAAAAAASQAVLDADAAATAAATTAATATAAGLGPGAADHGGNAGAGLDPAVAAAARAAGLDPADLDEQDIKELQAALTADAARAKPAAGGRVLVREANGNGSTTAISLLLEACERFGVNPAADVKPQELLAWRFYPGADEPGRVAPDAVVIVTAGGLKLKHWDDPSEPMDPDTEDRLRRVFHAFRVDPKTKERVIQPLPGDLTLPAAAVIGIGHTDHQYPGGYVKSGGKAAAEEKEKRRAARAKAQGLA